MPHASVDCNHGSHVVIMGPLLRCAGIKFNLAVKFLLCISKLFSRGLDHMYSPKRNIISNSWGNIPLCWILISMTAKASWFEYIRVCHLPIQSILVLWSCPISNKLLGEWFCDKLKAQ